MFPRTKIIYSLNVETIGEMRWRVEMLSSFVGAFKPSLKTLNLFGPTKVVKFIHFSGGKVFYDGKFTGEPSEIAELSEMLADLGVKMFSVHISAGIEGIISAVDKRKRSKVIVATAPRFVDRNNAYLAFNMPPEVKMLQMAKDACLAGANGIICSPDELEYLARKRELDKLEKIVEGIVPNWFVTNDQKQVMTPGEAIISGAGKMVIGDPITNPPKLIGNSAAAAKAIAEEIFTYEGVRIDEIIG